jgi:hypothetical protein
VFRLIVVLFCVICVICLLCLTVLVLPLLPGKTHLQLKYIIIIIIIIIKETEILVCCGRMEPQFLFVEFYPRGYVIIMSWS